jgi:uncharacterized protein (DUF1501 family)
MELLRTIDTEATLIAAASRTTDQAIAIGRTLSSDVTLATAFPNTTLGNQLKQVAKVIKFNTTVALGLTRQIFFCQLGGFDTHQNQVNTQSSLLAQVSQAVKAFYDASVELGLEQQITTFTLPTSDGRCSRRAAAPTSSDRITPGATTTSSSAAQCAAATSMESPDLAGRCSL